MTMDFGCPLSGFFDFSLSTRDCFFLWLLPLAILVVEWRRFWVVLMRERVSNFFATEVEILAPGLSYRRH
jgi:hypothetical protein